MAVLFFKRKYYSTWPDGVYWEVYVYEPVDMVWEPRSASNEIAPARRYFPEKAKDVPLAELSTTIVAWNVPLNGPYSEVSCWNCKTSVGWLETNVTEDRVNELSANPDVSLCLPLPAPVKRVSWLPIGMAVVGAVLVLVALAKS